MVESYLVEGAQKIKRPHGARPVDHRPVPSAGTTPSESCSRSPIACERAAQRTEGTLMKLYVTRHGETPMNAAHRVCGRTDLI